MTLDPDPMPDIAPDVPEESEPRRMRDRVRDAVEARDGDALVALLDPLPLSEAMRQLFFLDAEDRDTLLDLIPAELAARMIEEAPHAAATELVDHMAPDRAAEVLEELDTAAQADLIGDLEAEDAEAILANLDPEDAADVRRLAEYEDDTAGGLMIADVFAFRDTQTVAAILRDFAREDADRSADVGGIEHDQDGVVAADARHPGNDGIRNQRSFLRPRQSVSSGQVIVKANRIERNEFARRFGEFTWFDEQADPLASGQAEVASATGTDAQALEAWIVAKLGIAGWTTQGKGAGAVVCVGELAGIEEQRNRHQRPLSPREAARDSSRFSHTPPSSDTFRITFPAIPVRLCAASTRGHLMGSKR